MRRFLSRLGKIKKWIDARNPDAIVPFCADFEKTLVDLDATAAAAKQKEVGAVTAIPKLIRTGTHTAARHLRSPETHRSVQVTTR